MVIICCHLCVYVQSNLYFDCHAALPVLYVGKILIMKRISVFQSKIEAMLMINQMSYLITTLSWIKHPLQGGQNKTQLFYEGIQQFGTDLSMIQQLFPGQTRHQIKLKFKETQHALRLSEALSSRTKDHSYYEKVIEQLQQVAAQAEEESNRGNSVSLTEEEPELNPETNGASTVEAQDGDPLKYDEEEEDDDLNIWGSYKSEF
ncbi:transcription factor TFIIIB component B'' isoform X2 [Manihot esculenta]|uniref:Uncharacterized protein n=1 Tax=Manihot esculenta TaxID=3983 RepID=A0ACB7HUY1_MANES|nr:transcription factor TFIIIB component B'' isoform X2 [Manihot esculenta]KAG8655926.1 hypothetical protein MANES_04G075172v8 [Manihot esculenta]